MKQTGHYGDQLSLFLLRILVLSTSLSLLRSAALVPPPLPILPLPSASQLSWQIGEMALFLHFGTNTFTDTEWGTGHADPSVFDPADLDARQWARTAAAAGFSRVILTAKHHDGFCLWPSAYTNYSVGSSPFHGGAGDVVAELAAAAREAGIGIGLYLSPWDRHDPSFGDTMKYNEFYLGQMTELLTGYGEITEVWLDGAKGEGEKDMEYFFDSWFKLIHQLQPGAVIFSDVGPDVRWVGDEDGVAGTTSWSLLNQSSFTIGHIAEQYSIIGDPSGTDWLPPECDVSIRKGWFWHEAERPKTAASLLEIYYKSVGRNCVLTLNVPPNSSGLISDEDLRAVHEFSQLRRAIFSHNLAEGAVVTASSTRGGAVSGDARFVPGNVLLEGIGSYWAPDVLQHEWQICIDLGLPKSFNVLQLQEPIHMGQRVMEFRVELLQDDGGGGGWEVVARGTTIGYKRLLRFPAAKTRFLRLVIERTRADPLIAYLGIYWDPFSAAAAAYDPPETIQAAPSLNGSRAALRGMTNGSGSVAGL